MASPPYTYSPTALSPPPSQSFGAMPSSKKRLSDGGATPSLKRRKPSAMSASSATHPLRQTSFPPDDDLLYGARSPSFDSVSLVSGSQVSVSVAAAAAATQQPPLKKKRGRKSKAEKEAMREREQTPSAAPTPSSAA